MINYNNTILNEELDLYNEVIRLRNLLKEGEKK
jgi:hypothetical protein